MSGGSKYSDIDVWNINDRVYFTTASNCIYNVLLGTGVAAGIVWTNSIKPIDIATAAIFFEKETWLTNFERPVIKDETGHKVALLSMGSIARNAGALTLTGYSIPTTDQIGATRTGTPAIGAVEYLLGTKTIENQSNNTINVSATGRDITVTGLLNNSEMSVYGLTGNLLHKSFVKDGETVTLNHLQSNFVIVKVQNQSFKVLLK